MKNFFKALGGLYSLPFFILSIINIFSSFLSAFSHITIIVIPIFLFLYDKFMYKNNNLNLKTFTSYFILSSFITFVLCILFIIAQGSLSSQIFNIFYFLTFPFLPFTFITALIGTPISAIIAIETILIIQLFICSLIVKPRIAFKKAAIICIVFLLTFASNFYFYSNRSEIKYAGHGFDYMNGFSSTDLTDYSPYASNSKLATLNEPSTFAITDEKDMPILDGAEACYPVYSAIAKAVYKNIDEIEKDFEQSEKAYTNGKIVTFTNTSVGYDRLFNKDCDMFFGAKPSEAQLNDAQRLGIELEYMPIGKEGFVFFVNKDNPIDNLTTEQVKAIYHGDITNWKEVGGKDEQITAFQRPERSGSQSMMNYFMGNVSLKEPMTYERQSAMEGIIREVAQYHNESGAIGYTFRYFLEGLNQEKGVKILSIDNIKPSTDNIKNQSYPISTFLYCVTLKGNDKENVKELKDYLLSTQGQYIIEQTGYVALN